MIENEEPEHKNLISRRQIVIVTIASLLLTCALSFVLILLLGSSSECHLNLDKTEIDCYGKQIDFVVSINWDRQVVFVWKRNIYSGYGGKLGPPWLGFSLLEAILKTVSVFIAWTVGIAILIFLIIIGKNYFLRLKMAA